MNLFVNIIIFGGYCLQRNLFQIYFPCGLLTLGLRVYPCVSIYVYLSIYIYLEKEIDLSVVEM